MHDWIDKLKAATRWALYPVRAVAVVLGVLVVAYFLVSIWTNEPQENFVFRDGFEGEVLVVYGIPDAPKNYIEGCNERTFFVPESGVICTSSRGITSDEWQFTGEMRYESGEEIWQQGPGETPPDDRPRVVGGTYSDADQPGVSEPIGEQYRRMLIWEGPSGKEPVDTRFRWYEDARRAARKECLGE